MTVYQALVAYDNALGMVPDSRDIREGVRYMVAKATAESIVERNDKFERSVTNESERRIAEDDGGDGTAVAAS